MEADQHGYKSMLISELLRRDRPQCRRSSLPSGGTNCVSAQAKSLFGIALHRLLSLLLRSVRMELAIHIQVEELPEGAFLATSDELPGLVAQGRTVAEALDIARDVARKLIEARREREGVPNLPTTSERRDYTIVVAA